MERKPELVSDRRRCLRQMVHAPAFASFDGVTGGMILDLSEEGLSMQMGSGTGNPSDDNTMKKGQPVHIELDLSEPAAHMETTGYIAWADALGRAGVRFSELPPEARRRLNQWLTLNASAPSQTAPKLALGSAWGWGSGRKQNSNPDDHISISLEAETEASTFPQAGPTSATVQYEFSSLGTDLTAALRIIGERACTLTRGSSAAIALTHKGGEVLCRASIGESAPALGTRLDVNSGLSGECFRVGKTLRCDDAENDPRVDLESCRRLGIRSMVAAPVRFERDTLGLLMVFAPEPFNFDEGDVAVAESMAHTVVRTMRNSEAVGHH